MSSTSKPVARLREDRDRQRACCSRGGLLLVRATGLWPGDAIVWPVAVAALGALLIWRAPASRPRQASWAAHLHLSPRGRVSHPRRRACTLGRPEVSRAALASRSCSAADRLPVGERRHATGGRGGARGPRRPDRRRAHLRSLLAQPRTQPRGRAHRAHPLAGARRRGRAPARLGAADARAHPAKRGGPASGWQASPARRSASCVRWLAGGQTQSSERTLAAALEAAAAEVEAASGGSIELVAVGDCAAGRACLAPCSRPRARRC